MSTPEERMKILERLERGEISPEEAAARLSGDQRSPMEVLEALEKGDMSTEEALESIEAAKAAEIPVTLLKPRPASGWVDEMPEETPARPRGPWMAGLWTGVVVLVLGVVWMGSRLQGPGMDFWFYCSWLPLALGIALIALAWSTRNAPWLNLKVRSVDEDGERHFRFHIPLPLGLARAGAGVVRARISDHDREILNMVFDEVEKGEFPGEPIIIRADDDEDGSQVELIIA